MFHNVTITFYLLQRVRISWVFVAPTFPRFIRCGHLRCMTWMVLQNFECVPLVRVWQLLFIIHTKPLMYQGWKKLRNIWLNVCFTRQWHISDECPCSPPLSCSSNKQCVCPPGYRPNPEPNPTQPCIGMYHRQLILFFSVKLIFDTLNLNVGWRELWKKCMEWV